MGASSVLTLLMADSYGDDDVEAIINRAFSDPRFGPGMRLLVDAVHPGELELGAFADETEAIGWLER